MKFSETFTWVLMPLVAAAGRCSASSCRYLPGDTNWPSKATWNKLNATVDGRLIKTVPIGTPCHDPNYDADLCEELQDDWSLPQLQ